MNVRDIKRVYFLGIGGIGMSALARFFRERGAVVSGYDRTETDLTRQLALEGMSIHYTDDPALVDAAAELVIYTPAIPKNNREWNWYSNNGYPVYKRSDVLQWITAAYFSVTVAGTHGKTTVSTMIAYLLRTTGYGCNAFLGGISANYNSNYWSSRRETAVIEADEYDRSFLKLNPDIAVLTAMDPDHLDIYGTAEAMEDAFIAYTQKLKPGGTLLVKYGLKRLNELHADQMVTYSLDERDADVYAVNIRTADGGYIFDIIAKEWQIIDLHLQVGGLHNVENAVAAVIVTQLLGIDIASVKTALGGFRGVKRRFEYMIKTDQLVYIDDYAHHPAELAALIRSAKNLFPGKYCVVVFQPHLFSRTKDLADGFAESLDLADEVILLDIYPARELPVEGVTSALISGKMKNNHHSILTKEELIKYIKATSLQLLITAGAGDIDKMVGEIKLILEQK